MLRKDELADQVEKYVEAFHLNIFYSAKVGMTTYDPVAKNWTVTFQAPGGQVTATCRHLVQATGIGSQKPRVPTLVQREPYEGRSMHSVDFKSGQDLKAKGVKVRRPSDAAVPDCLLANTTSL